MKPSAVAIFAKSGGTVDVLEDNWISVQRDREIYSTLYDISVVFVVWMVAVVELEQRHKVVNALGNFDPP
jgi:hypothetical protein